MKYEVKILNSAGLTEETLRFLRDALYEAGQMYELPFDSSKFDIKKYADKGRLVVCFRDDVPVGFMMSHLVQSFWDSDIKILKQMLLWAVPKTRAANLLFKEFIDFGRLHADHIHTNLAVKTNISHRTLDRLGFVPFEVVYVLEN